MRSLTFRQHVKRFFRNEASQQLVGNPYKGAEVVEPGRMYRRERKVGFYVLFYDLFVVATLAIFTRGISFGTGEQIGSCVVFFTMIWTIWASQTIFDVRYGLERDLLSIIYGFLQLCVYGVLAAIAGSFNVSLGLTHEYHSDNALPAWVPRSGEIEGDEQTQLRSIQVASAVYAASRFLMVLQYLVVLYQARKFNVRIKQFVIIIAGLAASGMLWFGAFACSLQHPKKSYAIARVVLWVAGWVVEAAATTFSMQAGHSIDLDMEYWAERFAALTLIIAGEGFSALFDAFKAALQGPNTGAYKDIVAVLFAAVALYRAIYYLYFQRHSGRFPKAFWRRVLWGGLHYPLHLCLLLVTEAACRNVLTVSVSYGISDLFFSVLSLVTEPAGDTVAELATYYLDSEAGQTVTKYASELRVNRVRVVVHAVAVAQNSTDVFTKLMHADAYGLFVRLSTFYLYPASEHDYDTWDDLVQAGPADPVGFIRALDTTFRPLYVASLYAFGVLGGFIFLLGCMRLLQTVKPSKYEWTMIGIRCGLGVVLMLLSLLNIGGYGSYDEDKAVGSPMEALLIDENYTVALMTVSMMVVIIVDIGVTFWRTYKHERGGSSTSHDKAADAHADADAEKDQLPSDHEEEDEDEPGYGLSFDVGMREDEDEDENDKDK